MAGLTPEGFEPKSLQEIKFDIENELQAIHAGFDVTPDSPDGQLIGIVSSVASLLWDELSNVFHSYDPTVATGKGLRNISLMTGVTYDTATRSTAEVLISGVAGTVVQSGTLFSTDDDDIFYTDAEVIIPASVIVIASVAGETPVPAGAIKNIESVIAGMDGIDQLADGTVGKDPEDEDTFRNRRNTSVLRNAGSRINFIENSIHDLGISQVKIINNDTQVALGDGTPIGGIHVILGEYSGVADADIVKAIYLSKGLGVPTHGNNTLTYTDSFANDHPVSFSSSLGVLIYVNLDVSFLDTDVAGAEEAIRESLIDNINSLVVGDDVIWSRLFGSVTQHSRAVINSLQTSTDGVTYGTSTINITDLQFAVTNIAQINIVVT